MSYIAQVLLDDGYEDIRVKDYNLDPYDDDEFRAWIRAERFHVVGLTGLVLSYAAIKTFVRTVKEESPESHVVLGGGVATAYPEIVMNGIQVDSVVVGEGERIMVDLLNALLDGKDLHEVHGIYFRDSNRKVCQTLPAEQIKDLDTIPFPNRELFGIEKYLTASSFRAFQKKSRVAKMFTSRGCPYSCEYCFLDNFGHKWRYRSPENVVDEIESLQRDHGVTGVSFVDDVFSIRQDRAIEMCEEILRRGIRIDWSCSTRVNLVNDELLKVMKRSGCRTICYGIESANDTVLKEMNKRVNTAQAADSVERTWNAGIIPFCFFMIGYFGETEESFQDTVNFCIDHGLSGSFSFPTPFPGTELYVRAKKEGLIQESEELILEGSKEWAENLNVNLTDIPDERLMELKFEGEREVRRKTALRKFRRYLGVLKPAEFANYCALRAVEDVRSWARDRSASTPGPHQRDF